MYRVLLVDDEPANRRLCRQVLEPEGIVCDEAADGAAALDAMSAAPYDLVLLDIDLPRLNGTEVLRRLVADRPVPHLQVIMVSGRATGDEMARLMALGAADYVEKPFSITQLVERIKAALRLKDAQDRGALLQRRLLEVNEALEQSVSRKAHDLVAARSTLVLAMAELVSQRDNETGAHLLRLQHYCRVLAEEAASIGGLREQIDRPFIHMLEACAPLHDIGKVAVPDHILLKPGPLTPAEHQVMQRHTTAAAETLGKLARVHGFAVGFLLLGVDIARHHHERYDGRGYPDRLAGEAIPLAARIVALADVYDALRSPRPYKPALTHETALRVMLEEEEGHFDPALLRGFARCAPRFGEIYANLAE